MFSRFTLTANWTRVTTNWATSYCLVKRSLSDISSYVYLYNQYITFTTLNWRHPFTSVCLPTLLRSYAQRRHCGLVEAKHSPKYYLKMISKWDQTLFYYMINNYIMSEYRLFNRKYSFCKRKLLIFNEETFLQDFLVILKPKLEEMFPQYYMPTCTVIHFACSKYHLHTNVLLHVSKGWHNIMV